MKKTVSFLLILTLCVFLVGCGKSEDVISTEEAITAIGEVDKTSLDSIENAEVLYAQLEEKEKRKVENSDALEAARQAYDQLIAADVIAQIDALEDDSDEIENAIGAYEALTDGQKKFVSNYDVLKAAKEADDARKIAQAEELIGKLRYDGTEAPDEALEAAVAEAQKAYDSLDEKLQMQVRNADELERISAAISQYRIAEAQAAIDEAVASDSGYSEAEKLYQALSAEQQEKIKDYDVFQESYTAYKNRPPIELTSYVLKRNSIGQPELYVKVQNTSGEIIKTFSLTVFAFDEDGVPVTTYFNHYAKNLNYSDAVKPGEFTKSNSYWQLYGEYNEMKQIVVILNTVEFFDGSTWENSEYGTLYSKYDQQLLEENDSHILPRG